MRVALVGGYARGHFLADGKAAGNDLLRVRLVHVGHDLLEGGAVETLGEDFCPTDDAGAGVQGVHAAAVHFGLDGVFEGFDHLTGFVHDLLPFIDLADDGGNIGFTHGIHSFLSGGVVGGGGGCGSDLYPLVLIGVTVCRVLYAGFRP